ncbi:MAG TPA: hypothetical protein GXX51_08535 [Firmicutes bacterium]|nr:hypothetical protein [Bacillota bacterium]
MEISISDRLVVFEDDARGERRLRKILYLATMDITRKWRNYISQFTIQFGDRIEVATASL